MRIAILLAALASITAIFAQTKEVRRTIPLSNQGHVEIDTYKGEVRVTTWDQPQVEVYARIEPDGTSTGSLQYANETEVRIDSTGDSLHLKSDYPKWTNHLNRNWNHDEDVSMPFVRYTIRMPRTAELRIKDYKSEIEVTGLSASLDIDTYKGETRVKGHSGAIRMNTFKGHGVFELSSIGAHNRFETFKGEFDIQMPGNASFDVVADSGPRATIRSSFPFVIPAGRYSRSSNFTARVNGGGSEIVLKSYKGDVNIH